MFEEYLNETYLLDYKSDEIKEFIKENRYRAMDASDCIRAIYSFCRDEIKFYRPFKTNLKASEVLKAKRGGAYTKGILFMALLRGSGIPARLHIYKSYKHLLFGLLDKNHLKGVPDEIRHYVVEAYYGGAWIGLDGIILDSKYIDGLRHYLGKREGAYIGYGIGTGDIKNMNIDFNGGSTEVMSKAISGDVGIYATPDEIVNKDIFNFTILDCLRINRNIKKIRLNSLLK